jgi:hypothetical protein
MPPPPSPPRKNYIIAGKVQYHGADVSGAKIDFDNETTPGTRSITSSETDSNFAAEMANLSEGWSDGDTILIAVTHDGRRGQKRVDIDVASHRFGEDVGTSDLQAHWGCAG